MAVEISLIRHGETEANAAGIWQGTSDSPLSATGQDQISWLSRRFASNPFDLVVTSDLGRAYETSLGLGDVEVDERWRELHLGSWEGLNREEIASLDPDALIALRDGEDISFGGGERVSEMIARLREAFSELVGRLEDGERAAVVSHGGALFALIGWLLGVDGRGRLLRLTNTSVSTVRIDEAETQLTVFNDPTHLPGDPVRADTGATHIVFARHGESVANRQGRWQGRTGGELTAEGRAQAESLRSRFPRVAALYSSPLDRAWETARLLSDGNGMSPEADAGLEELSFGSWEMMTTEEIAAADPDALAALAAGTDIARGKTGETFGELRARMAGAVAAIAARHEGETVGLVSHGAATRALATEIVDLDFANRFRLGLLDNTAMARFVYGPRRPSLASWNLTPHLQG
jgi:probable phosphoglycerate mutase